MASKKKPKIQKKYRAALRKWDKIIKSEKASPITEKDLAIIVR